MDPALESLKPVGHSRLIDLVRKAGVDVTAWMDSPTAAANPYYCYRWAISDEAQSVIVFNIWFDNLKCKSNQVFHPGLRQAKPEDSSGPRKTRALEFERLARHALGKKMAVRVILLDGRSGAGDFKRVYRRQLDPNEWIVEADGPVYRIVRTERVARRP